MPQSSPTPRRGRPGYDRQTLLAECVELFNRHGYEATSMGMLAAHLGISKSAIYHHVESKEAILDHAVTEALDALEACLDDVVASGADAGAQVEAAIRGTLGVLAEKQPEVTLLLRLRGNSAVEVAAVERRREITRRLGDLLEFIRNDPAQCLIGTEDRLELGDLFEQLVPFGLELDAGELGELAQA